MKVERMIGIPRLLALVLYPVWHLVCLVIYHKLTTERSRNEFLCSWVGWGDGWEVGKDSSNVWFTANVVTKQYGIAIGRLSYVTVYRLNNFDVRLRKGSLGYRIWKLDKRLDKLFMALVPFKGGLAYEVQVGPLVIQWYHKQGRYEVANYGKGYNSKGVGPLRFSTDEYWWR
jgi:hypothetical protein